MMLSTPLPTQFVMLQSVVAVIDGTKARLFTLEPAEVPQYQSGPNLIERESLTNQEILGKDIWTETKTGRNRGSGGQAHAYDDHRENHLEEFERSFAKEIVGKIADIIQTSSPQQLILVAEPHILGLIREGLLPHLPKSLKLKELAKDLCKLKPSELHEYLAERKLLPVRKVIAG